MKEYNIKYETNATLVLTMPELISILKNVLVDRINIDLDKLEVNVLAKYTNNRLHMTLDAELIRRKDILAYMQFIDDVKKVFGPYIFTVNTAIETNILINKLFAGFDYYVIKEDMTIELYY